MPENPQIHFYVSNDPAPVHRRRSLWTQTLPLSRTGSTAPRKSLTYGNYFTAVSRFIDAHRDDFVATAASCMARQIIDPQAIFRINIHLEKHGAFYHPSKIVLCLPNDHISCVVNVAVSDVGRHTIDAEYSHLERLAGQYSSGWVPRVFGRDRVEIGGERHVRMFLGEWFEAFHEFHLSNKTANGRPRIRVWDPEDNHCFLSLDQAQRVYAQAATILTAYYDIATTEHIASWHHAAGDFVVKLQEAHPLVKLISVRQYQPLIQLSRRIDSLEEILNAVLIFFLDMSIHLRIDRMEGVDEVAWVEMDVLPSILQGFFRGLAQQAEVDRIPHALPEAVAVFFSSLPAADIRDICLSMIKTFDPRSHDVRTIHQHLNAHLETLVSEFSQLSANSCWS